MSRIKKTKTLIEYLEKRINCENIINTTNKYLEADDTYIDSESTKSKKILVYNNNVAFKIIKYIDEDNNDENDRNYIKKFSKLFDFITEANYTGYEYFPYLYGVLNCRDGENSKIYVYYEYFSDKLSTLINNLNHISEWYDIIFQLIMINYYLSVVNKLQYNGSIDNHSFITLNKPYHKQYKINGNSLNVLHKFLIVYDNFYDINIDDLSNYNFKTNIDYLIEYISTNSTDIKILPSNIIITILKNIQENPSSSMDILYKYFNSNK